MALTPEDVVNKRFQPTKFREGYDQDEVDDFLDEVVVELRRLGQENEELRQRLGQAEARAAELQRNAQQAPPQPAQPAQPAALPQEPTPAPAAAYPSPAADPMDPNGTNNLLQLARRLHEEHVREGVEKRDALIAEGHATAARIVAEAEAKQRAELSSLDQERTSLERRIDELRNFEREYRQKLRGYIETQLRELDNGGSSVSSATAPSSATEYEPAGQAPAPAPVSAQPAPAPAGAGSAYGNMAPPAPNYSGFGGGN